MCVGSRARVGGVVSLLIPALVAASQMMPVQAYASVEYADHVGFKVSEKGTLLEVAKTSRGEIEVPISCQSVEAVAAEDSEQICLFSGVFSKVSKGIQTGTVAYVVGTPQGGERQVYKLELAERDTSFRVDSENLKLDIATELKKVLKFESQIESPKLFYSLRPGLDASAVALDGAGRMFLIGLLEKPVEVNTLSDIDTITLNTQYQFNSSELLSVMRENRLRDLFAVVEINSKIFFVDSTGLAQELRDFRGTAKQIFRTGKPVHGLVTLRPNL